MSRIVVGTDASPAAAEAVRWAVDEGEARGAGVTAVLAWDYLDQPGGGRQFDPKFTSDDAARLLDETVVEAVGDRAGTVQQSVVCDLPARALLEAAADADLVVVGARGLGSVRGALLGSVSQQVVHHSPVPVAVVRSGAVGRTGPVVVAVDGSDGAQRALAWALDEARAHGCPIRVVYAWYPPAYAALPVPATIPDTRELEAGAAAVIDEALAAADTSGIAPEQIERKAVFGTAVDAILDAAKDARVLVVGSRGRGGFKGLLLGSVSQHLVHHAECPVVVVPKAR